MSLANDTESQRVLGETMEWGRDFVGFEEHHATDAVMIARAFTPPHVGCDKRRLLLSTISTSFWFWLDDRSDACLHLPESPVHFGALLQAAQVSPQIEAQTPEVLFLTRLGRLLMESAHDAREHEWWLLAARRTLEGVWKEEQLNRSAAWVSYAECVENGIRSSAVEPIVAATSLIYRLERFSRKDDRLLGDFERHFCVHQRLLNDIHGTERDSREGRKVNALLVLGRECPRIDAREFVGGQVTVYERILREEASMQGKNDRFAQLTLSALSRINEWYSSRPPRYESHEHVGLGNRT
jgi:hypothetical protein